MASPQVTAPRCAPTGSTGPLAGVVHVNERHAARFTVIGNHLSQHRELSLLAIGLAAHIQSLPAGARVGIKFLSARFPESEARIAAALRELEAQGYLARRRERLPDGRIVTRTVSYNQPKGAALAGAAVAAGGAGTRAGVGSSPRPGAGPAKRSSGRGSTEHRTPERGASGGGGYARPPREAAPAHLRSRWARVHKGGVPGAAHDPISPLGASVTTLMRGMGVSPEPSPAAPRPVAVPSITPAPVPAVAPAPVPAAVPVPAPVPAAVLAPVPVPAVVPAPALVPAPVPVPVPPLTPTAAPGPVEAPGQEPAATALSAPPPREFSGPGPRRLPRREPETVPAGADPAQLATATSLLGGLRERDRQLALGEGEIGRLAPLVLPWLERGVRPETLCRTLVRDLPHPVKYPAKFLRHRLTDLLPPAPAGSPSTAAHPPHPMQNCEGCDRAYRAPEPGRCGGCTTAGPDIPTVPARVGSPPR
ncbi:hypothetical protein [uncultured Streptomyces sp.]|uniref:hypothetical protein n=1 Tax=uncultured Streptomyces sp. TaxID=174707 RepID=UPI0026253DB4|nr:hypothetical protein [uncultured Streptomyces sp.]